MSEKYNKNNKDNNIFDLLKNNDVLTPGAGYNKVYKLIKERKISNLDIRDNNYNYFIQYIVNYNQYKILELIQEMKMDIRLDILDVDGRTLLYNCIKFNYVNMLNVIINYNKKNIGISILDIKDKLGLTGLHYSVIFNNFDTLKILLDNNADPYIKAKDGNNVFMTCLIYKRDDILKYLIDRGYSLKFKNNNGENILQVATLYHSHDIINLILKNDTMHPDDINYNNMSGDLGLTVLNQSIIVGNYELFKQLLDKNIDINLTDFYGNSPLHYIIIENRLEYLNYILDHHKSVENLKFNISNINGDIPLHLLLDSDIILSDIKNINKIILETDLNLQNNSGDTCFMKMYNKNIINDYYKLLILKPLNAFIENNNSDNIDLTKDIVDILVESFYNQLKVNKDELILEWEINCINNKSKGKGNKSKGKDNKSERLSEEKCKDNIRQVITKEKRSLPKLTENKLVFDNGIFMKHCFYTGNPIDILFGLIMLNNDFKKNGLNIILDYPLTINNLLENHYFKLGINYPYVNDFSNIEIIWSYQKIFYPSFFDFEVKSRIKTSKYIIIPIGIDISLGSHANILFWDVKNKTIERFEPNGSNYPIGFNYNPELLDEILEEKFKSFDSKIKYYKPYMFLPTVGFQLLENLENDKCKKIGDPNGFCSVWCAWWVYQRMLNINLDDEKVSIKTIANILINTIKMENKSFKNIIRNFSHKIVSIRDSYLEKINLDINDWILNNYTHEQLNNLEKLIITKIK